MAIGQNISADSSPPGPAAIIAGTSFTPEPFRGSQKSPDKGPQTIALAPAGTAFGPGAQLAWLLGFLGVAASIAPWPPHGWLWFELMAALLSALVCYDALALWLTRNELAPILMQAALRGREGQSIQVPFALAGSGSRLLRSEVRVAIMPATRASAEAMRVKADPDRIRLVRVNAARGSPSATNAQPLLWPWTAEFALLRRGIWPAPRVGVERRSRMGVWCLRRWFDLPVPLRIDPDLRAGRREILRSPVYRALVASRQTPWSGRGRDFERLREYQPGDNYSEIAWKSTARRGAPVTRLFQWEQKQEVYFVVDHSRASALALAEPAGFQSENPEARAPRRLLDLAVETALAGASVALELGDDFGLITYAEEPTSWLRAGSGLVQFHQFRDRLLNLEPLPTTADYEALFSEIRLRLRRRAYLVLLADLTERAISDSLRDGLGLVRSSHVVLMTSILPDHARPAFSGDEPHSDLDVYSALAGEKESQRLGMLARQLRRFDVQLRFVPAANFLRAAVEGYLEGKREQRL